MMKKHTLLTLFLLILTALSAQAQEEDEPQVLFSEIDQVSGFGGPLFQFGSINGETTFYTGGGGAVLLNRRFWLGGYGMGMTSKASFINPADVRFDVDFGHGGFWLGYIFAPNKVVHLNLQTMIGWGGASYQNTRTGFDTDEDGVFVLTPQLEVELNLTNWMRVGVGGGYQIVSGLDLPDMKSDFLDTPMGMLSFKFGWFR